MLASYVMQPVTVTIFAAPPLSRSICAALNLVLLRASFDTNLGISVYYVRNKIKNLNFFLIFHGYLQAFHQFLKAYNFLLRVLFCASTYVCSSSPVL